MQVGVPPESAGWLNCLTTKPAQLPEQGPWPILMLQNDEKMRTVAPYVKEENLKPYDDGYSAPTVWTQKTNVNMGLFDQRCSYYCPFRDPVELKFSNDLPHGPYGTSTRQSKPAPR